MKLELNEQQITQIINWANELPAKYSMSFLLQLDALIKEQNPVEDKQEN
jgi:hypothetical protein